MSIAQTASSSRKPLRLWPGVAAAVLLCILRYVIANVVPGAFFLGMFGGLACAAAIVVWWLLFSRAPWSERVGAVVAAIAAYFVTKPFLDKSIATGMMNKLFLIYALPPVVTPAFVAWAVATRRLPDGLRRASMVATIFLACGAWTLFRTEGIRGEDGAQLAWRWTKTAEERLLTRADDEPKPIAAAPAPADTPKEPAAAPTGGVPATPAPATAAASEKQASGPGRAPTLPSGPAATKKDAASPALSDRGVARAEGPAMSERAFTRVEWPGFRGPNRDGIVRGVRIETDWSKSPPQQLWRRPIGLGWSSFAVSGNLVYTQEQRGEDEIVACHKKATGEPVWRHRDRVRFWESNGGAGPRATPTISNGRIYAFGATGILNALDAATGAVVWSRNVAANADKKVPMWGFSSSPLVIDDIVVVAASGRLVAYDIATGKPRWFGPARPGSYSSPHRATIDGVVQILLLSAAGVTSVAPANGTVLWEHAWGEGTTIVQPALTPDGDVLINAIGGTGGAGIRRLAVAQRSDGWKVEERWTSTGLKPYFNDFVVHKGHAFGFDGSILSCIDLSDGSRKWKGGRYGNGQLVLLPDEDLLLVLSEGGELALVKATPDQFTELARFKALEGKTWNHPVLVGDVLLVRNGEEMAAFRLPSAGE